MYNKRASSCRPLGGALVSSQLLIPPVDYHDHDDTKSKFMIKLLSLLYLHLKFLFLFLFHISQYSVSGLE